MRHKIKNFLQYFTECRKPESHRVKKLQESKADMLLLMEPVKATISIKNNTDYEVFFLNHDGNMTGNKVSFTGHSFKIDGTRDKTLYYLIVRKYYT